MDDSRGFLNFSIVLAYKTTVINDINQVTMAIIETFTLFGCIGTFIYDPNQYLGVRGISDCNDRNEVYRILKEEKLNGNENQEERQTYDEMEGSNAEITFIEHVNGDDLFIVTFFH